MHINGACVLVAGAIDVIGDSVTAEIDARASAVHAAAATLGGLDAVLTVFGSVAFGMADETGDGIAEHLMTVNGPAPAASFRAVLRILGPDGAIAAVTGVAVERAQSGMADYRASKSTLSAWLDATRREARPAGIRLVDIRLGHLGTPVPEQRAK